MTNKRLFLLLVATAVILGNASNAVAKKGFYIGAGVPYNTVEGDFNGNSSFRRGDAVIIVPDIEGGFGVNLTAGYGINDKWAIELNLLSSRHNGKWQQLSGNVDYASFSINGKYNFRASRTTQPYLLFGVGSHALTIKDGARDLSTGQVSDATLLGPGFNFGTGIDQYIGKNLSLTVGIMYRYVHYTLVEGVHENSGSIDDELNGSGMTFLLGTIYHF